MEAWMSNEQERQDGPDRTDDSRSSLSAAFIATVLTAQLMLAAILVAFAFELVLRLLIAVIG